MTDKTDQADRDTLRRIGDAPGVKRSDAWITKAAVTRLINSGLVAQPSTSGRLYLTLAGRVELSAWYAVTVDNTRGLGFKHGYPCEGSDDLDHEWHLLGTNRAGHPLYLCDTSRHLVIQPHPVDEGHECVTSAHDCASADLATDREGTSL